MPMTLDFKYVQLTDALCKYVRNTRTHELEDLALADLQIETRKLGRLAVMQIPEEQGALLRMLVSLIGVDNAFEVGTFTGYSSICIAAGLTDNGRLTTCDTNPKYGDIARGYWKRLSLDNKVDFVPRDALAFLRELPIERNFDFAFVDADRLHYLDYFEELVIRVRRNGLIAFDNMLAKGNIEEGSGKTTVARKRLNSHVAKDTRVQSVIVPIGDGMLLCRVKG